MQNLIDKHYFIMVDQNLISVNKGDLDIIDQIVENYHSLTWDAINARLSQESIYSVVQLIASLFDILKHYGVEFIPEYKKNIELQESKAFS